MGQVRSNVDNGPRRDIRHLASGGLPYRIYKSRVVTVNGCMIPTAQGFPSHKVEMIDGQLYK